MKQLTVDKGERKASDQVSVDITHEITVNGDKSWVKLSYSGVVEDNETSKEAIHRIGDLVNTELLNIIMKTVELIEENS